MPISLDATYSLGKEPTGVGIYSREISRSLVELHPDQQWAFYYRAHRYREALGSSVPRGVSRRLLLDNVPWQSQALFHGLNQRLPQREFRHTIATFHDLFVLSSDYSTPEFRARFTQQAREAASRAEHIIAVSEFTARQTAELLNYPAARITTVHHGIRQPGALAGLSIAREDIVLHVGAIQKRKNIARLIDAFRALPDHWRLVLAGSYGYGAKEIEERVSTSPCRDRIVITGYVNAQALAQWYSRARIFAFPSLDEGFGMPVLEAMQAGTPVLTSQRSALPEVAGDAALLVDPFDTATIADGLTRLATDEALRDDLITRGLRRVQLFTWTAAAEKTWAAYRSIDPRLQRS